MKEILHLQSDSGSVATAGQMCWAAAGQHSAVEACCRAVGGQRSEDHLCLRSSRAQALGLTCRLRSFSFIRLRRAAT